MIDFETPQRQSVSGILVLFAAALTNNVRHFATLFLIAFLRMREQPMYILLSLIVLAVAFLVIAILKYWFFTFELNFNERNLLVKDGVINKSKTVIQFENIQQVTLNQSFVHKISGVYEVIIDTAGTSDAEVKIKAVSKLVAEELKDSLTKFTNQNSIENQSAESKQQERQMVKISVLSLIKASLTSNYLKTLALIMAFLGSVYETIHQANIDAVNESTVDEISKSLSYGILAGVLVVLALFLLLIVNFIRVFVRYFGLQIVQQENNLEFTYGLLNTRSTNIRPNKVQQLTIEQNYLQKKLKIAVIKFRQAGGLVGKNGTIKSALDFPGIGSEEVVAIRRFILGDLPTAHTVLRSNWRKPVFASFLVCFIPVILILVFADLNILNQIIVLTLLIASVLSWNFAAFRNYKLEVADGFLYLHQGLWDKSVTVLPINKLQAVKLSQLAWHKNLDLASLKIETAGGSMYFNLGNRTELSKLVNNWLFGIESSNPKWN
jgi:putative membrane protein